MRASPLQCQRLFWCGAAGRQPYRFEPSSRSVTAGKTGRCTYKGSDGDMILAIDEESGACMTDPDSGTGKCIGEPAGIPGSPAATIASTSSSSR